MFGREFNEALVHQVVIAYQANARLGTRAQKERSESTSRNKKPWRQKGTGRARAGMASSPLWRGGGKIFPTSPDENFSHKVNRKMLPRGDAVDPVAAGARGPPPVVEEFKLEAPKTKLLAQKLKAMGLDEVLVITDERGREPLAVVAQPAQRPGDRRAADRSGGLLRFPKVLLTRKALAQLRGDAGMSAPKKYAAERLMQVLLAPQVSEKSTFVGEKNNQYVFRVARPTRPSPRSRRRSS